jgi:hypothetical protein
LGSDTVAVYVPRLGRYNICSPFTVMIGAELTLHVTVV